MLLPSQHKNICFQVILPAVVEVELRREAGGLGDRALLGSTWCRLRGCRCRRGSHCLACLSWCLARLSSCWTCLTGRLAGMGASLSRLRYGAGLGLGAVFLGHGALLLRAGARMGTCVRQRARHGVKTDTQGVQHQITIVKTSNNNNNSENNLKRPPDMKQEFN